MSSLADVLYLTQYFRMTSLSLITIKERSINILKNIWNDLEQIWFAMYLFNNMNTGIYYYYYTCTVYCSISLLSFMLHSKMILVKRPAHGKCLRSRRVEVLCPEKSVHFHQYLASGLSATCLVVRVEEWDIEWPSIWLLIPDILV